MLEAVFSARYCYHLSPNPLLLPCVTICPPIPLERGVDFKKKYEFCLRGVLSLMKSDPNMVSKSVLVRIAV